MCGCLSRAPNWGPGQQLLCPDWELNQWPFCLQAGVQSSEPHQPGLDSLDFKILSIYCVPGSGPGCVMDGVSTRLTLSEMVWNHPSSASSVRRGTLSTFLLTRVLGSQVTGLGSCDKWKKQSLAQKFKRGSFCVPLCLNGLMRNSFLGLRVISPP